MLRLRAARARIAAACMPAPVDPRLGSIVLRADQCASAARAAGAIARDGGCLLADDVGRGKTYVALAVARAWQRPLVVVPAALRPAWRDAMHRSGVSCALVSHEELSRGRVPRDVLDGVIVDESHHFRSTDTRRYAALSALTATTRLLLLSATPLQNRTRDLAAQIALFHGARAFSLDAPALASFVVRGGAPESGILPAVAPPRWAHPTVDDGAVLEAILALPSPATPVDGGDAGVLRTIGLVRAWASSRAALRAAIRRRRRVAAAIEASAAEGRRPTRRELAAWREVDGSIQLGFASLLANAATDAASHLLDVVSREHLALARLESVLSSSADPDVDRIALLRDIRATHADRRLLAFTEFATTAEAYFRGLRGSASVGLLTARDARIASGRLPRDALLERFAPRARQVRPPVERERVTLLIATDLLSEGVNLQDASVVVHLDLPWNPARLAQRVGRVRRPGGAAVVHSYLMSPPAAARLLLDVERRLREKLDMAARAVGRSLEVVPSLASCPPRLTPDDGRASRRGAAMQRVAEWARPRPVRRHDPARRPIVAAVACEERGWLAALDDGRLVAAMNGAPANVDDAVGHAVERCDGPARFISAKEAAMLVAECEQWIAAELLARQSGRVQAARRPDGSLDRRLALAVERAPRHLRASAAANASRLIATAAVPRPLGAERALRRLVEAPSGVDAAWLSRAVELGAVSPREHRVGDGAPCIVALIALGPPILGR